jgi:HD-GYP domain-containing protein (c-di-GMP phosphodiesterase class II)
MGCLAVGLLIHHRLVASAVCRAVEQEASNELAASTDKSLAAVSRWEGSTEVTDPASARVLRGFFEAQPSPPDVQWLLVDPQWRILDVPDGGTGDPPTPIDRGERLAWVAPPKEDGPKGQLTGTFVVGDRRHVAVAAPWNGHNAYLVAHRSLERGAFAPADVVASLPAAAAITWVWTSALLGIVVYLILTGLYEQLAKKHSRAEAESLRRIQSLVRTRDALIFGLARLAEWRDEITGRHVERVSFYASRLAATASHHPRFRDAVTPEFMRELAISSVLHDIGKVGIEDSILFKPGRLTEAERARMQKHSTIGGQHLAEIERRMGASRVIRMAREIALWHHERWDGTGYPDGLAGEQIPLAARITAIADVYEALASPRPYKPPFPHEQCVEMIRSEAGKQFDPDLVEAFLKVESSFRQVARQYGEQRFQDADSEAPRRESGGPAAPASLPPVTSLADQPPTIPTDPSCTP